MLSELQDRLSYFKRFRMELDVQEALLPASVLPAGYSWVAWNNWLLDKHAEVKFLSFVAEIDAQVFPSLGSREGCRRLMEEISGKSGFIPEATWMIACHDGACRNGYCGTVQGVRDRCGLGAIQNLGVTAEHRGKGLGAALMLQALHGFRNVGVQRVHLEVTASNMAAIRLYRGLGFRCRKTIYKAVENKKEPAPDWAI